jgi:16S rRNA (cytidine1402-2'-O)-methyltransferase
VPPEAGAFPEGGSAFSFPTMATLFIVSTPIGNLGDITRRAEEVLGRVSVVYAEDTRRSRVLLDHLGISVPLVSLHEHNERARSQAVLGKLDAQVDVALISDAGTPLISDPGVRLVEAVTGAGHHIVPIPGASSVLTALVGAGLPTDRFCFLGFAPRKGVERAEFIERIADSEETTVLFESPERLCKLLEQLRVELGDERGLTVARELTKLHEEFVRGTVAEVAAHFDRCRPRGEVTVVVAPTGAGREPSSLDVAITRAVAGVVLGEGMRPTAAARELAGRLGISRNDAYAVIRGLRARGDELGSERPD